MFDNPRRPATRAFINRYRSLEFDIVDREYDLYGIHGSIEQFAHKYFLSEKVNYRLKLIFEEIVSGILPFTGPVHFKIDYSEKDYNIYLEVIQEN